MNARDAFDRATALATEAPMPLTPPIPKAAPYPVEALGPLRAAVEAVQDISQAPVALAAQSALSVAALAVQALGDVETLTGASTPTSLFALTIAESGERKSTCDKLLMKPVHAYARGLNDEYHQALASFRDKSDLWQSGRAAILKASKSHGDSTRADLEALGPEPARPTLPSIVAPDPTYEGLVKALDLSRPALGIFSDEGGAFIGGYGMSAENRLKTMAGLSSFWDGTPINRTRASDGVSTFYGRRLACHLMVQPAAAAGLLSDPLASGQGFLARFLIAAPPSAIGTRLRHGHARESRLTLDNWSARIDHLLRRPLPIRPGTRNELEPPVLRLCPEARTLLQSFADAVEIAQAPEGALEAIRPFASKAAEHAVRLAGVLTLFADPEAGTISPQTMADAITLADHYLGETARSSASSAISQELQEAEKLRAFVVGAWPYLAISVADVVQSGPYALRDKKKAARLIQILESHNHLTPLPEGAQIGKHNRRVAWRIVKEIG